VCCFTARSRKPIVAIWNRTSICVENATNRPSGDHAGA
jgi:hypothetical protein